MGWNHPDITLEEMVKLTKGFVDILILASGYQSSGRLAHWDPQNIKKAFQWGIFFENVFSRFSSSDAYQESVEELDAALSEITSNASFPQGLAQLSSATLTKAVGFVLEHFVHTLPLRDTQLKAFLTAVVQMELDELSVADHDCLNAYLNKLTLQNASLISSPNSAPTNNIEEPIGYDYTKYAVQEILKRQCGVSHISTVETGLNILSNAISTSSHSDSNLLNAQLKNENSPVNVEQFLEFITWKYWKSRSLSYFLDQRTVRLVSGASLIFSAPKVQWMQVFQGLNFSSKSKENDSSEMIELLLLGCIASRWNFLIEHFSSFVYNSLNTLEQYNEVCNLVLRRSPSLNSREEMSNSKESGILDYLTGLLGGQPHQLWKMPPALAAAAIPLWSPLLRLYMSEMETQFRGDFSTMRCCNCTQDMKEHNTCELAERIWCLYVIHVRGSHLLHGATTAP